MARTGVYKSEVEKVRNSLLAQGRRPSVDAVRIALGNTGSKTTIHKHLKELEAEDGREIVTPPSISESLQHLVAQLAQKLEEEGNERIEKVMAASLEKDIAHEAVISSLNAKIASTQEKLDLTIAAIKQEMASHEQTKEALQSESMAHHTLAQQVVDLRDRLAENDSYRQSLEEKHQHARDALNHYRESVKEQREQDMRQHEQQVQMLQAERRNLQQTLVEKQNEITRLNKDGARWVAEISLAQKTIYENQASARKLNEQIEALRAVEQKAKTLQPLLIEKDSQIKDLAASRDRSESTHQELEQKLHLMEIDLASANGKLAAQEQMMADLKSLFSANVAQKTPEDQAPPQ